MGWEEAKSRDPVNCPANHNPSNAVEGGGAVKTTYHDGYASRACSQVIRITEGHLRLTEKLLYEQRRNLLGLPAKGRWTGHQCPNRDSGPVVVGGVTPTQGAGERPAQGEGV